MTHRTLSFPEVLNNQDTHQTIFERTILVQKCKSRNPQRILHRSDTSAYSIPRNVDRFYRIHLGLVGRDAYFTPIIAAIKLQSALYQASFDTSESYHGVCQANLLSLIRTGPKLCRLTTGAQKRTKCSHSPGLQYPKLGQ